MIAAKAVAFKEALSPGSLSISADRQERPGPGRLDRRRGLALVSGGTDNHLILVDVFSRGVTGKRPRRPSTRPASPSTRNTIPFDTNKPMTASGIRIGTPRSPPEDEGEGDGGDRPANRPRPRRIDNETEIAS